MLCCVCLSALQVGLNGVDNGAIRFNHVRVPRVNLLDRFGSVDKSGTYSSPLSSPAKRFAATLGELTGGRVGLTCGSVGVLKGAVTIAIRYSSQRQQVPFTNRLILIHQSNSENCFLLSSFAYLVF